MTDDEFTRVAEELERTEADEHYQKEFAAWYDHASFPSIESYCRTGWIFYRLKIESANRAIARLAKDEDEQNFERARARLANEERNQGAGQTTS